MGMTKETFEFIHNSVIEFNNKSLCDFGAQQFKLCPPFGENTYTSEYYKTICKEYISIDLTGEDCSLQYDLCKPLPEEFKDRFDIVLDIGTAEHVENIYMCLKNMHDICKVGGYMVHVLPSPNNWPNHGFHYFPGLFFIMLALEQDYDVIDAFQRKCSFGGNDSTQTHVILHKTTDRDFVSPNSYVFDHIFKS